ncbi:DUF2543 family protein [Pantoea allii]|uniref:DUF2543 family protein n=1 Tax=Pantoea allii TaxID=574096 RepID=UPI003D312854
MDKPIMQTVYGMVDEYSSAATNPVTDDERECVARYINNLVSLLMEDGFTREQQVFLALGAGVRKERINEIGEFLRKWGLDE